MSKVYVAAPWVNKDDARAAAKVIEEAGYEITERWWDHPEVGVYPGPAKGKQLAELVDQAEADIAGVEEADAMVVLQYGKSEGKAFEQGLAYCMGLFVVVVSPSGDRGHLFQYMDHNVLVSSVEAAVQALKEECL